MNNLLGPRRLPVAVWFAALLLAVVSCSTGSEPTEIATPAAGADADDNLSASVVASSTTPTTRPATNGADLSELITELPSASGIPEARPAPIAPTALRIGSLGVETAPVIPVGLDDIGDMEVPPADEVGWYRFGPAPGEAGSSVLAAHIAYDGEDGVFVNLDEIQVGSTIEIDYEDGTTAFFVATQIEQYGKLDLPKDSIFNRTGDPQLVLITCGGEFNSSLRSYEDNVVVYAAPTS